MDPQEAVLVAAAITAAAALVSQAWARISQARDRLADRITDASERLVAQMVSLVNRSARMGSVDFHADSQAKRLSSAFNPSSSAQNEGVLEEISAEIEAIKSLPEAKRKAAIEKAGRKLEKLASESRWVLAMSEDRLDSFSEELAIQFRIESAGFKPFMLEAELLHAKMWLGSLIIEAGETEFSENCIGEIADYNNLVGRLVLRIRRYGPIITGIMWFFSRRGRVVKGIADNRMKFVRLTDAHESSKSATVPGDERTATTNGHD